MSFVKWSSSDRLRSTAIVLLYPTAIVFAAAICVIGIKRCMESAFFSTPASACFHQDWTDDSPNTLPDMMDYIQWTNSTSCRLAHALGGRAIYSLGVKGQKTVCMDPSVRPTGQRCVVYSFNRPNSKGNDPRSFEEAIGKFGCEVHIFNTNSVVIDDGNRIHQHGDTFKEQSFETIHGVLHQNRTVDYLTIDIREQSNRKWIEDIVASGAMEKVRQLGLTIHLPGIRSSGDHDEHMIEEFRHNVAMMKSLEASGLVRFDSRVIPQIDIDFNSQVGRETDRHDLYALAWFNGKLRRPPLAAGVPLLTMNVPKPNIQLLG